MLLERFKATVDLLFPTEQPIYSYFWTLEKEDGEIINHEYIEGCTFDLLLDAIHYYGFDPNKILKDLEANGKCEFSFETDREEWG
jgi:hypothetical protein